LGRWPHQRRRQRPNLDRTLGWLGLDHCSEPKPRRSSALLAVGDIAQSAGFRLFKCCQCGCNWRRLGSRPGSPQVSPLFMHWDGQIWTVVDPPAGAGPQFAVAALSPSDVWSAGSGFSADNTGLFNHWDGTAWTTIPNPPITPGGVTIRALSALAPSGRQGLSSSRSATTPVIHPSGCRSCTGMVRAGRL